VSLERSERPEIEYRSKASPPQTNAYNMEILSQFVTLSLENSYSIKNIFVRRIFN